MTSVISFSLGKGQVLWSNRARIYLQHPRQASVQFSIDTFQIRKSHFFPEYHLVETDDEISVQEATVEDAETKTAANELEVVEMLRVDPRGWVNLKGIIVVSGIFE